ncbi:hypothetical protein JOQ06_016536, partial [Pogonophryne albipinna]
VSLHSWLSALLFAVTFDPSSTGLLTESRCEAVSPLPPLTLSVCRLLTSDPPAADRSPSPASAERGAVSRPLTPLSPPTPSLEHVSARSSLQPNGSIDNIK